MAVWASSDWHCAPETLKQDVVDWIYQGNEGNHRLVGVEEGSTLVRREDGRYRTAYMVQVLPAGRMAVQSSDSRSPRSQGKGEDFQTN